MAGWTRWSVWLCVAVVIAGCGATTAGHGSASLSSTAGSTPPADFPATSSARSAGGSGTASSAPATGGASTVVVTVSPAAPSAVVVPGGFLGTWYGHGRVLRVRLDGRVNIDFRTYVPCTATVTTGCDRTTGSNISDGGHVSGLVSQVINSTTVMVTFASSTAPSQLAVGTYRLGHDLGHHALALFAGQWSQAPFCGPGAPSGYCGA